MKKVLVVLVMFGLVGCAEKDLVQITEVCEDVTNADGTVTEKCHYVYPESMQVIKEAE